MRGMLFRRAPRDLATVPASNVNIRFVYFVYVIIHW
jgi:hypothetical protein